MKNRNYNLINGPRKTVSDYLQSLNNNDLQTMYTSGFFYNINIPGLMKKLEVELQRRNVNAQPVLF